MVAALVAFASSGLAQDAATPAPIELPPGLSSPEPAVRIAALREITMAPTSPRAIAAAAAALVDRDQSVRNAAVDALLQRPDLVGLRDQLLQITIADMPKMVTDIHWKSYPRGDLAPIVQRLADADAEVRCTVVKELCGFGPMVQPHLEALLARRTDPAPTVRAALVAGIANVAWSDEVRKVQLLLLKDEVADVRVAAATALGVDRDEAELVAALRGAVQDPEVEVRAAVLRAFGQCGKGGLAAVLDVLGSTRDREAKVRAAAFDAMASFALADARALRELGRGLADADRGVLRAAIQAAGAAGTGAESLLPRLLELTRHEHAEVRAAALQAAFAAADPARRGATVLRLVESLLDADEGVRTQAESCLRSAIVWG